MNACGMVSHGPSTAQSKANPAPRGGLFKDRNPLLSPLFENFGIFDSKFLTLPSFPESTFFLFPPLDILCVHGTLSREDCRTGKRKPKGILGGNLRES
jgi:hypothetical protein